MSDDLLRTSANPSEQAEETSLRPRRLDEFVGLDPAWEKHFAQ